MRNVLLSLMITTLIGVGAVSFGHSALAAGQTGRITVRTENYPRPPYSGATYYIYERGGEIICTKLQVCNKFDDCDTEYRKGSFKDEMDIETGDPYGKTAAVVIPTSKLRKHVCLTRFKLIK